MANDNYSSLAKKKERRKIEISLAFSLRTNLWDVKEAFLPGFLELDQTA